MPKGLETFRYVVPIYVMYAFSILELRTVSVNPVLHTRKGQMN